MTRFIARRLGAILLISLAIVLFCSFALRLLGQPSGTGQSGLLGLVRQSFSDAAHFWAQLFSGNLGTVTQRVGRRQVYVSVSSVLLDTYTKSMGLLTASMLLAVTLGIGLGVLSAIWEGSPLSLLLLNTSILGTSMPTFFLALLLQVIEITWYQRTGVRLVPVGGFGWDSHLILPALVLCVRPLAQLARITLVALSEVAHQDYVRTAWAKGLAPSSIWAGHIVPNAMVSLLTAIGVSLRFSLGSLPVVEYFFGWPGLGARLLDAISRRQAGLVIPLALALGLTFMLINLALEVAYRMADPQLREQL